MPKHDLRAVLALGKTIFAQPAHAEAKTARDQVLVSLDPSVPKAAALLRAAEEDILTHLGFMPEHHGSISPTDAIEPVNVDVDRGAKVVGFFPNAAALLRLATATLHEQHDEWQ